MSHLIREDDPTDEELARGMVPEPVARKPMRFEDYGVFAAILVAGVLPLLYVATEADWVLPVSLSAVALYVVAYTILRLRR